VPFRNLTYRRPAQHLPHRPGPVFRQRLLIPAPSPYGTDPNHTDGDHPAETSTMSWERTVKGVLKPHIRGDGRTRRVTIAGIAFNGNCMRFSRTGNRLRNGHVDVSSREPGARSQKPRTDGSTDTTACHGYERDFLIGSGHCSSSSAI
jgi:hypothetical protein